MGCLVSRFLLSLFIIVTQLGCAGYPRVGGEAPRVDKVQAIKKGVATFRGLSFSREVPIEVKNKGAILRHLESNLLRQYGERKLHNLSLVYAKIGLLPRGLDLKDSLLDYYAAGALGFYDLVGKKLVLRQDIGWAFVPGPVRIISGLDGLDETVLAHELTHALQDQHFSLQHRLDEFSNDDKALAFRSVAEGDATLTEFGYRRGGVDKGFVSYVNDRLRRSMEQARPNLSNVPGIIADKFLFQYFEGVSFLSLLLAESGWIGINRLYASPPLSTEQVLHPEKYFYEPDPPTRVELNDLSLLYPSDWIAVGSNTLGEVMVRSLFKQFLSVEEAKAVAQGWDGDRFWAFRKGKEVSFIWVTVWDSFEDAREFAQKYGTILTKKYSAVESGGARFYLEQRDHVVMVVVGPKGNQIINDSETLWRRLVLTEESFTPPLLTPIDARRLNGPDFD